MWKPALYAAAVVVVVAMSGCGASGDVSEPAKSAAASETSAPVSEAPVTLDADATVEAEAPTGTLKGGEEVFLNAVRAEMPFFASSSDEKVIAAGHSVCDQLAEGSALEEITAISNDVADEDWPGEFNQMFVSFATQQLCVEFATSYSAEGFIAY